MAVTRWLLPALRDDKDVESCDILKRSGFRFKTRSQHIQAGLREGPIVDSVEFVVTLLAVETRIHEATSDSVLRRASSVSGRS